MRQRAREPTIDAASRSAFSVNIDVEGVGLDLIGWILAAAGVIGLIAGLALARRAPPVVAREEAYPTPRADPRDPRY
ncbi:MAG: hypothetical protein L0H64_18890 [Pseudonocardia sp.]|nr:hypothetical protein [Pseudonocardia sp.]